MKITEKIGFVLIFGIVLLGLWLSHNDPASYVGWYAGQHAMLEWLTLASIACGIIACLYRASILAPFRKNTFVTGLYISSGILLVFGVVESSRRWGMFDDFVPGWFVAFLFFAYLVILPLCYLKYPKVRKRVDDWAIPLPRLYHDVLYVLLIILHYATPASAQRPEQLQFGACWLFFMVMMEPLNRIVFSRTTIER